MKIDVMLGGGLSISSPLHRARQNPTKPAADPARHASITQPIGRPLPSCSALTATLAMFTELGWPLFTAPAGGLFVWASPGDSGPDPLRLAEWARAADILLAPGCLFRPDRADTPWLRFNVAFSHGEALRRFLLGHRRG